ncbi:glycine receptor subunit alpha-4-like isoform X2 [Ischnura elegans]|uniref:glycine receptor subunit alpha-4-like isoform X2 n=1 Tax=Ischnura elegans TaxID=197161 RepID=UPI001ED8868A|nr:glycine receptor subunit alpha-4-like isoform X2 [Ischnura elegans]
MHCKITLKNTAVAMEYQSAPEVGWKTGANQNNIPVRIFIALLFFCGCLGSSVSSGGAKMDHLHILDELLRRDYDRRATPTNQFNNATSVICELYIRSFGSISPVTMDFEVDLYLRQKWQDERLKHDEITEALDLNDPNLVKAIWKPEVYFPNAKHAEFQYVTVPNVLVRINPDGEILYMLRLKLTFSCMMDLSKFPLDSQICTMEVASFSKTTEELRLTWKATNPVIMGKGLRMPQFEIVDIFATDCQESFQIGNYSCLVAEFYLSRSVGFHLVQSYLPTLLIVVISWVSFWMDVDSVPGRTTLGVTTLLAVSSQSSGIQSGLPQVSYVKAIDVWMGTCTAFVFCALLEFTIVNYMWRRQPNVQQMKAQQASASAISTAGGVVTPSSVNGDAAPTPAKVCFPESSSPPPPEYVQDEPPPDVGANNINYMRRVAGNEMPGAPLCDSRLLRLSQCRDTPLYTKVLARKIDEWCRLCFPLAFLTFNLIYWPYFMLT